MDRLYQATFADVRSAVRTARELVRNGAQAKDVCLMPGSAGSIAPVSFQDRYRFRRALENALFGGVLAAVMAVVWLTLIAGHGLAGGAQLLSLLVSGAVGALVGASIGARPEREPGAPCRPVVLAVGCPTGRLQFDDVRALVEQA